MEEHQEQPVPGKTCGHDARTLAEAGGVMEVKSEIEGVSWPGLFSNRTWSMVFSLLFQMEQSQWWSPRQIREHQFRQLNTLLRFARNRVPFYREQAAASGIHVDAPVTEDTWERIPILTRGELQANHDRLKSDSFPGEHGGVTEKASSGSTGTPIRVLTTELCSLFWHAVSMRDHIWHRRDLGKKFAAIKTQKSPQDAAYPDGAGFPTWGVPTRAFVTGPGVMLNLNAKVHEQAEWLMRQKPDYLLSYPSILEALARFCREQGVRLHPMLEIRSMSEILRPEVRQICREQWGVEIKDMYSTEETGYIALQCPGSEQMLVQAESIFVEILDRHNRPCAPGAAGQVVVTPLHNFAMPLIRYAVGDLAIAGGKAACGRGLPVIERVLGRTRNMIRLPDGSELFPDYQDILRGFGQVSQFQVVQKSVTQLEMKLVSRQPLSAAEEERLRDWLRTRFRYPFAVAFSYHAEIPRTRRGKYLDFVSEL